MGKADTACASGELVRPSATPTEARHPAPRRSLWLRFSVSAPVIGLSLGVSAGVALSCSPDNSGRSPGDIPAAETSGVPNEAAPENSPENASEGSPQDTPDGGDAIVAGAEAPAPAGVALDAGTPGLGASESQPAASAPGTAGTGGATVSTVASNNPAGTATTIAANGQALQGPSIFAQALGSNGRTCTTCHSADQGMSIVPTAISSRFEASGGMDPLFRPIDGAVAPSADVSTLEARRAAYALLLSRGLVRVRLPIPILADFDLVKVEDPYGCATTGELSLYRRPLPAANLRFLTAVMWDGREGLVDPQNAALSLRAALSSQARNAVLGHAEGTSPPPATTLDALVDFELGLFVAQTATATAGALDGGFAFGGPSPLVTLDFFPGINAFTGTSPTALPFNPTVFSTFAAWAATDTQGAQSDARRQTALGESIFNTRTFEMSDVPGLTSAAQPTVSVTCSSCHNSPQVGSNSTAGFFDLGVAAADARGATGLPLYTFKERSTGKELIVTDPGRGLITGAFSDLGTFKVPTLRGLAARAPYFHNGAAATVSGAVGFYNGRFKIGLTDDEKTALTAFLSSL